MSGLLPPFLPVLFEIEHAVGLAFRQQTEWPRHFLIGFGLAAGVVAEAVLVELLVRRHVSQAATVGPDLVSQDEAALLVYPVSAAFEIDVHEAAAARQTGKRGVWGKMG